MKQNPEIDQGIALEEGSLYRRDPEQFSAVAWGFFVSNVFAQLTGSASKTLFAISTYTDKKYRSTLITNFTISKCAGLNPDTVKKDLRELEYYHFIERHDVPGGTRKERVRKITLQRWDTAKEKLIKDKKVTLDTRGKVSIVTPNPYRK